MLYAATAAAQQQLILVDAFGSLSTGTHTPANAAVVQAICPIGTSSRHQYVVMVPFSWSSTKRARRGKPAKPVDSVRVQTSKRSVLARLGWRVKHKLSVDPVAVV